MANTFVAADPPPLADPEPAIASSNDANAFASSPHSAELGNATRPLNLRQRALLREGLLRSESAPDLGRSELVIQADEPQIRAPLPLITKSLLEPSRPIGKPPGWKTSALNIARYSWLNVLIVFIPISWAMHFSGQNATVVFCTSFVAIIPLAALLGLATEEMALRVGDTMGGLLNATFGNTTELIIAILALVKGELRVVQSSMLGSILSNCLLVLGTAYMAGGLRFHEQGYQVRAAQLNINLLGIAVTAIVIPVAYAAFTSGGRVPLAETEDSVLKLSRGIAILLLFVYGCYLVFQLWTHSYLYIPARRGPTDPPPPPVLAFIDGPQPPTEGGVFRLPSWGSSSEDSDEESAIGMTELGKAGSVGSGRSKGRKQRKREKKLGSAKGREKERERKEKKDRKKEEKEEKQREKEEREDVKDVPKLSLKATGLLLLTVTALTAVTAEWLVGSIEGLTATGAISTEFVALILLPLVGNVAEHVTAVTVATKGKIDLSMAVAVGSSIQIALFVIPLLIILGWCIGQPLTLFFDTFETIILFVSIVTVNWAIGDGRSNWLEGLTLAVIYVIIAVVVWYYPGADALAAL